MLYFFVRAKNRVYHVFYTLILNRLGFGNRVSKDIWEKEYSGGAWEHLYSEDERAHYISIINQLRSYQNDASILDIGCGDGVLFNYLKKNLSANFRYKGIDISDTATKRASEMFTGAEFVTVNYDKEDVNGQFNVIIFNETLYYFTKPVKTLLKATKENLAPGGVFIISMWDHPQSDVVWKNIKKDYLVLEEEVVKNSKGQQWKIKTLAPVNVEQFDAQRYFNTNKGTALQPAEQTANNN